jgi:short/branched chain acyl-CoA dehydrogenase
VIEAVGALAELQAPVRVMGIVGATENLPGPSAVKPGDIVRAMDGTTIEINNTDAEGRLVLSDCITYALREGCERLVDIATLTGAVVTALGRTYAGLMSNDDDWARAVEACGHDTGELLWRLPLHDEYAQMVKGRYADQPHPAPRGQLDHRRRAAAPLRRRRAVGAPRHRRHRLGRAASLHRARCDRVRSEADGGGRTSARRGPVARELGALMQFDLSDDHRLLRDTVRDFARQEIAPVAEELDRTHSFPYEIVKRLGELDLMGIPFPEEYGGAGGDSLAYALAVEELTRVDSSVAITLCAHTSLGTQPIYLFGSEAQKQEWMPRLCSGERLGAFGLTEPEAGSDAGNTQTRAVLADGEWVINGSKQFITNAGTDISGVVVITAVTGESRDGNGSAREISNLLVANGTPGYEPGEPYRKMGWNASDTRPLTFADCRVPEENLVGGRGAGLRQFFHVLDIGRIGVAAMGVGLAQGALDQALEYSKERRAFGRPISRFQTIQAKLADLSTEIEACRLLVYKAAWQKDHGQNFTLTAAQAKLKSGRLAVHAADEAVQVHGGYGYIEEYPVCRFYRDAKILTIGEGTDEVQEMVIGRALGM